jgi:hypothetical protein
MKNISTNKKRIEHRGFDISATKNFDLEMKMVKAANRPATSSGKKSDMSKFIK